MRSLSSTMKNMKTDQINPEDKQNKNTKNPLEFSYEAQMMQTMSSNSPFKVFRKNNN